MTSSSTSSSSSSSSSSSGSYTPREWSPSLLSRYTHLLFDCDGVLWHESDVVPGAIHTLQQLERRGCTLLFVTNNSGKSRASYASKMQDMGFTLTSLTNPHTSILSSSYAAAAYLSTLDPDLFNPALHTAFFLGDTGIADELRLAHIRTVDARQLLGPHPHPRAELARMAVDPSIRAVIVGIDDQLTYSKIAYASALLTTPPQAPHTSPPLFIATNRDSTLPTSTRDLPGAGACVAAVETASGHTPINLGKPERLLFDLARADHPQMEPAACLMIGDRLDTDIAFGMNAGVDTLLVETGIHKRGDVMREGNRVRPTYILPNVNAMLLEGTQQASSQ